MKEIISVIRINKMNETKKVLSEAGYPSMTAKKVSGRGKKMSNVEVLSSLIDNGDLNTFEHQVVESITEKDRMLPKIMFTMVVADEDVKNIVELIIETNQTGSMGDGKIFICDVDEAIRIRTNEHELNAI